MTESVYDKLAADFIETDQSLGQGLFPKRQRTPKPGGTPFLDFATGGQAETVMPPEPVIEKPPQPEVPPDFLKKAITWLAGEYEQFQQQQTPPTLPPPLEIPTHQPSAVPSYFQDVHNKVTAALAPFSEAPDDTALGQLRQLGSMTLGALGAAFAPVQAGIERGAAPLQVAGELAARQTTTSPEELALMRPEQRQAFLANLEANKPIVAKLQASVQEKGFLQTYLDNNTPEERAVFEGILTAAIPIIGLTNLPEGGLAKAAQLLDRSGQAAIKGLKSIDWASEAGAVGKKAGKAKKPTSIPEPAIGSPLESRVQAMQEFQKGAAAQGATKPSLVDESVPGEVIPQIRTTTSESYIQAKQQPGGKWKLFFKGTRNEVFPNESFDSAGDARMAFRVAKAKAGEVKPPMAQPKPAAQMAEPLPPNQQVVGSSPAGLATPTVKESLTVAPEIPVLPLGKIKPPLPPKEPPTNLGGTSGPAMPEDVSEGVIKDFTRVMLSKKGEDIWNQVEELRRQARAQRAGAFNRRVDELLASGVKTEEAIGQSLKETMSGQLPTQDTGLVGGLTDALRNALFAKLLRVLQAEPYEVMSTKKALDDALAGKPIPRKVGSEFGSAYTRLLRVFGDEPAIMQVLDNEIPLREQVSKKLLENGVDVKGLGREWSVPSSVPFGQGELFSTGTPPVIPQGELPHLFRQGQPVTTNTEIFARLRREGVVLRQDQMQRIMNRLEQKFAGAEGVYQEPSAGGELFSLGTLWERLGPERTTDEIFAAVRDANVQIKREQIERTLKYLETREPFPVPEGTSYTAPDAIKGVKQAALLPEGELTLQGQNAIDLAGGPKAVEPRTTLIGLDPGKTPEERALDFQRIKAQLAAKEPKAFKKLEKSPGFLDYIQELYINNILSGPPTHIINFMTNMANTAASPMERALAVPVERVLSRLQGRKAERFWGEVPADAAGALQGIGEGVRSALYTIRTGINPTQATKYEMYTRAFKGRFGRVANAPTTVLEAADAMNYSINYRAALNAEIIRAARSSGLSGEALIERIAEIKTLPPKELLDRAVNIAEGRLFRDDPGDIVNSLMHARDKLRVGRFVVPFMRTPSNIVRFGLARSPVGILNPKLYHNLKTKNPEAADQIARIMLGSGIGAGIAVAFANGKITGAAPTNRAEKDLFYRQGKQPFSVRVGDKWISYQRVEPFNQTITQVAMVINAVENKDELEASDRAAQAVFSIGQNLVSQSYLSSISRFLEGLSDPGQAGADFLEQTLMGLIPATSLNRRLAMMVDPTIRQPQGIAERVQTGIPGLSQNVPARLDVFGRDVERTSPPMSPININQAQNDPVDNELARLKLDIGFVGDSIKGVKLDREEQHQYQQLAGQLSYKRLVNLVGSRFYQALPDDNKEKAIKTAVGAARDEVRRQLTLRWQLDLRKYQQEAAKKQIVPATPQATSAPNPVRTPAPVITPERIPVGATPGTPVPRAPIQRSRWPVTP